jgi:adenine-specific DNA-methyltransferase
MEKLKLHSKDLTAENIDKIAALFPNCVTETKAEDGAIKHAIDFDLLRQELSADLVEGPQERYRLDWPGKREALATANAPIAKTLRPCPEESVDFDTTKNLYIEGDNLDALKLLQETYLGKVKMIYIDPPYNTGKDFVYSDNFTKGSSEYFEKSNQTDDHGNRLITNPESNGRFHSDWLTMMYSRLRLAHSLLTDDGVIFVSLDDGEIHNLRKMCDEIFGEDHFSALIIWKKKNTPPNDRPIGAQHDYILAFSKSDLNAFQLRPRTEDQIARYKNPDNHPQGPWVAGDLTGNVKGGRFVQSLHFPVTNPRTGVEHYPGTNGNWRFNSERISQLLKDDEIYFGKDDQGKPKLKRFLSQIKSGVSWSTLWDFAPMNTTGSSEMTEIFGSGVLFESPKPIGLLELLLQAGTLGNSLVLDFFSGSATTAHAVMQLNAEDGGSRRHIMVQLPEACDEKSNAFKTGYATIAEIGKERIRRAGAKIKDEIRRMKDEMGEANLFGEESSPSKSKTSSFNIHPSYLKNPEGLDTGFRVLKVDSSNMADVYYRPDEVTQDGLALQVENIKPDRSPEDLLFQVLLDWGVELSLKIENLELGIENEKGKPLQVFMVDGNALLACFDPGITEEAVKEMAKLQPLRAVFRDASFANDATKINIEQIFKALSPHTELKSI